MDREDDLRVVRRGEGDLPDRRSAGMAGVHVLTSTMNSATPGQMFLKRALDILGGIVGSLAALIIMAIVGPKIKKASPGPILFTQERIGQNGKRFKMYKIRSMYMDAEARKAELMTDMTQKQISKIEIDGTHDVRKLKRLADVFGMTVDELLDGRLYDNPGLSVAKDLCATTGCYEEYRSHPQLGFRPCNCGQASKNSVHDHMSGLPQ